MGIKIQNKIDFFFDTAGTNQLNGLRLPNWRHSQDSSISFKILFAVKTKNKIKISIKTFYAQFQNYFYFTTILIFISRRYENIAAPVEFFNRNIDLCNDVCLAKNRHLPIELCEMLIQKAGSNQYIVQFVVFFFVFCFCFVQNILM